MQYIPEREAVYHRLTDYYQRQCGTTDTEWLKLTLWLKWEFFATQNGGIL